MDMFVIHIVTCHTACRRSFDSHRTSRSSSASVGVCEDRREQGFSRTSVRATEQKSHPYALPAASVAVRIATLASFIVFPSVKPVLSHCITSEMLRGLDDMTMLFIASVLVSFACVLHGMVCTA